MLQELSRRWHAGHRGPALDPGRLPHYWGQRNLGVMPQAPIRSFPPVRTPHATRTSNRVRSFHDLDIAISKHSTPFLLSSSTIQFHTLSFCQTKRTSIKAGWLLSVLHRFPKHSCLRCRTTCLYNDPDRSYSAFALSLLQPTVAGGDVDMNGLSLGSQEISSLSTANAQTWAHRHNEKDGTQFFLAIRRSAPP